MNVLQKFIDTDHQTITLTDPDLALVNKFAMKPMAAEDVWLGRLRLCNDKYDRSSERVPREYLERIAATAPDRPLLAGHNKQMLPLGRFYAARLLPDADGSHYVSADYYLNRRTQSGQDLISDIEAGIIRHVSVTATCGPMTCDLCQQPVLGKAAGQPTKCTHRPGRKYDGKKATATYDPAFADEVEMWEGSFVFLGAQYGAEVAAKGLWEPESRLHYLTYYDHNDVAHRLPIQISDGAAAQGGAMFDTLEKALTEIERLQKLPLSSDRETELQKAISDLNGRVEPLERQVTAARDWQFAEIRRLAGITGETQIYERLLAKAADDTWDELEPTRKELAEKVNQKLGPVDPQGTTGGPDDEKPRDSEWKKRRRGGYF